MGRKKMAKTNMRAFVRELILERHNNPPEEEDTLRHGMFYAFLPRIQRFAEENNINIQRYDRTHKQTFSKFVYKTMSSVLSQMVLNGETSYRRLKIIETERERDEAIEPDHAVEIWFEKNGLMRTLKPLKAGLNISLWSCKGFQSTNILEQMVKRLKTRPVRTVFILSDFDPSGLEIPRDLRKRAKRLGIKTKITRIGINPEQIPPERRTMSLVQLKPSDSRYAKFVAEHGNIAYEVEALSNREIRELVVGKLMEEGVDFDHSTKQRFMENQRYMSRIVTESILLTLKRKVRRSALERIKSYDDRKPTTEQLIDSICSAKQFLDLPQDLIRLVAEEVKEEFGINPEDDE
jgi:hypothetical protein